MLTTPSIPLHSARHISNIHRPVQWLVAWLLLVACSSAFALGEPSWIEDPTHAIEYLQADLALPEPKPEMEPAALVAGREKAFSVEPMMEAHQRRAELAERDPVVDGGASNGVRHAGSLT